MNKEEAKIETQNQNPNSSANPNNQNKIRGSKGKSCKGCLYYSSALKSKSQNPTCVGIPRTLQQVPRYIIGESELEASKEGRTLTDFKYACVGYSVFLDNKDSSADNNQSDKPAELPFCVGLEVLLDRTAASNDHVPANMHKNKDSHALPQPLTQRPTPSTGDEFYNRFKRNAGLVATGVVKNVNKIGNRIKETLDDIMYRRPK
ncbi:uncharacterized protein LOC120175622 [Hibiscus syriacus]|uniref:uncharacterized protein LOC120175622 n=1 Tax=Hibiscus syriacus TaxID=106335 RepID=UPI0019239AAC|nr:uncharacterized protein LOC120175622 [Hibiscus syriacus]